MNTFDTHKSRMGKIIGQVMNHLETAIAKRQRAVVYAVPSWTMIIGSDMMTPFTARRLP
jgi:hypothetical protein